MPEIFIPKQSDKKDIYDYDYTKALYKISIKQDGLGEESNAVIYNSLSNAINPGQLTQGDIVDTVKFEGSLLPGTFAYGDGSDGDITITSGTTFTKDMYYNTLVINSGVTVNPGGYRLFCKTKLHNNGIIARNGNNGSGVTGGSALASGSIYGGLVGGNGGAAVGADSNGNSGTAGVASNPSIRGTGNGSAGGDGGNTVGYTGGGGGVAGAATVALTDPRNLPFAILMSNAQAGAAFELYKGRAGSAGGGSGASQGLQIGGTGGGAGSTGGMVWIAARHFINEGSITVTGGNGANGENGTGGNAPGGGGGGGGGGGVIILIYQRKEGTGTTNVAGGTKGTKGASYGSASAATDGEAGNSGLVIELQT